MPYIQVDNTALIYRLRRSSRAKHMHIRALQLGFEIVAPFKIKNHEIVSFAWRQRNWMFKIQSQKRPQDPLSMFSWPLAFLANETIPYRGGRLMLHLKYGDHEAINILGNTLIMTLAWNEIANEEMSLKIKGKILNWYQRQALTFTQRAVTQFCPIVGAWPKDLKIKQQKTRWGSCSAKDIIYINWLLILAPEGVLEYVVLHEICHLIHRNHGKRFWAKVAKSWPMYFLHEQWLSRHGHQLQGMQLPLRDTFLF